MMQIPIELIGVHAKIERAKEHISELIVEVERFKKSNPYEVMPYKDAKTGDTVFVLHVHASLPLRCNSIVGDIVQNLRSSLEYLARQLVLTNGGKPTKHTAFPISASAEEFESGGLGKIRGASAAAMAFLKRLNPYRGGNDALWRLHQLSIVDKHHEFITVGLAHEDVIIDFGAQMREIAMRLGADWAKDTPSMEIGIRPANRQYPLVDGTPLYRISAGVDLTEADMNPKFTLQVTFGEGEVVQGEPVFPTLQQLVGAVEETVKVFHPLFLSSTTKG